MDDATQTAVAHVSKLLDSVSGAPEQEAPTPETTQSEDHPETESPEPESEGSPAETAEQSTDEVVTEEPQEESEEPQSYTLNDLAEAAEMDADKFLDSITTKVQTDDGEQEVTLRELTRGHLREASFTRKTQELAEQRRTVETQLQGALEGIKQRESKLDDLIGSLEGHVSQGPSDADLVAMAQDDPAKYVQVMEAKRQQDVALGVAKAERQKTFEQRQRDAQTQNASYRQTQQTKLAEMWPEMTKPEEQAKVEGDMRKFLKGHHYTDDEVSEFFGNFDHRQVLLVKAAMDGQGMKRKGKGLLKELKNKPPVMKPGTVKRSKGKLDRMNENLRRHRKSGTRDSLKSIILDKMELGA